MQFSTCVNVHKHRLSVRLSVHKHSATRDSVRAMHMDAHVCFVLDPLSSNVNLTLSKEAAASSVFPLSLILVAGPL